MNHYEWCEKNLKTFFSRVNIDVSQKLIDNLMVCDGDKIYQYKYKFEKNNIPFFHGVAMYLMLDFPPYSSQVRETQNGFISPSDWIIENYPKFKNQFQGLN